MWNNSPKSIQCLDALEIGLIGDVVYDDLGSRNGLHDHFFVVQSPHRLERRQNDPTQMEFIEAAVSVAFDRQGNRINVLASTVGQATRLPQ